MFTDVQPGEREVVVSVTNSPDYSNNQVGKTVNVLEPTRFLIRDYESRQQGDQIVYDVTVENTGVSGTREVGARLEGENNPPTEVWFVFDLSGSMTEERDGAIESSNAFVSKVKSQVPNTMFGIATATFERYGKIENCRKQNEQRCKELSDETLIDGFVKQHLTDDSEEMKSSFADMAIKCKPGRGTNCRTFEPVWDSVRKNVLPNSNEDSNLVIVMITDETEENRPRETTLQKLENRKAHIICACAIAGREEYDEVWGVWEDRNPNKSDYVSLPNDGSFEETLVNDIGNVVIRSSYNSRELQLDRNETETISISVDTSDFDPGTYEATIVTSDDSVSTTTDVE